jgi:8-oxo-dGTP pyrophosphatase MutT (NUDIX family)
VTDPVIHRVTTLDLTCRDWSWSFAEDLRDDIAAHFAAMQQQTPEIFNGRILMGRNPVFTGDRLCADYFETDFASFLAWRDWGFPDGSVFNGFGMGALRSNDGAFVMGEMSRQTSNAGKIYFPSGTPDRSDLRGAMVDIAGSVAREVGEEVGLTPADYVMSPHWDCVVTDNSIAMLRILDVALPGAALRAKLEANLATQAEPELCAIHLVRSVRDLVPAMPGHVHAFIAAQPEMKG